MPTQSARANREGHAAAHIDMVKPLIPLGRVGQPREIAGLATYLPSEESVYMTGSSLRVDGGFVL